jgi:hypothetical protein
LAPAKGVVPSYVSRVLRLTLLAPDIVDAAFDGRQPEGMPLEHLLRTDDARQPIVEPC